MSCVAQNRFRNSIYKLKKTAESGIAGKICYANVKSIGGVVIVIMTYGGGLMGKRRRWTNLNHAVHHIDMVNWIEGSLPEEVTAMLANVMHDNSEVEDLSIAVLRYQDGSLAQVTSSVVHHGKNKVLNCSVQIYKYQHLGM